MTPKENWHICLSFDSKEKAQRPSALFVASPYRAGGVLLFIVCWQLLLNGYRMQSCVFPTPDVTIMCFCLIKFSDNINWLSNIEPILHWWNKLYLVVMCLVGIIIYSTFRSLALCVCVCAHECMSWLTHLQVREQNMEEGSSDLAADAFACWDTLPAFTLFFDTGSWT